MNTVPYAIEMVNITKRFPGIIANDNVTLADYDVRSGQGPITISRAMSGGNQQKAIIGREIDKDPQLLIAVQPIRILYA